MRERVTLQGWRVRASGAGALLLGAGLLAAALLALVPGAAGRREAQTKAPQKLARLMEAFRRERFVAYTPTDYDPRPASRKPAAEAGIRADLEVLRPHFTALVTYGCQPNDRLDRIVPAAAERGFRVVLGVWDVKSAQEMETAIRLARDYPKTVLALLIGNETQLFRRAEWEELEAAIERARVALPDLPISTTEPITSYGNTDLRRVVDFHAPNCHWVFQGGEKQDARAAVAWLKGRLEALRSLPDGDKPVLVKESGLPSGPLPFSTELQAKYWRKWFDQMPNTGRRATVAWEAFDLPWKSETNPSDQSAIEQNWGWWTAERRPKAVTKVLPRVR